MRANLCVIGCVINLVLHVIGESGKWLESLFLAFVENLQRTSVLSLNSPAWFSLMARIDNILVTTFENWAKFMFQSQAKPKFLGEARKISLKRKMHHVMWRLTLNSHVILKILLHLWRRHLSNWDTKVLPLNIFTFAKIFIHNSSIKAYFHKLVWIVF